MTPTERDLQTINALEEENEELRLLYNDAEVLLADAEEKLTNLRTKLKRRKKKTSGFDWKRLNDRHWVAELDHTSTLHLDTCIAYVFNYGLQYKAELHIGDCGVLVDYYTRPDSARRGCERALQRFAKNIMALANGEAEAE